LDDISGNHERLEKLEKYILKTERKIKIKIILEKDKSFIIRRVLNEINKDI